MEAGLPVMRNLVLFRNLSEIPFRHMDAYGDEPRWVIRGLDTRAKITDHPYDYKESRAVHGFSREELLEVFTDTDVSFSGFAFYGNDISIDIYERNRPQEKSHFQKELIWISPA